MLNLFSETSSPVLVPELFAEQDSFLSLQAKAKVLLPQIDWVLTQRKTEYLPRLLTLSQHPSVAVRRKLATGLSVLVSKVDMDYLKNWQERESDRQTWLALESLLDKLQRIVTPVIQASPKVLTVSEALVYVKQLLGQEVYVIEGELSEVRMFRNMYYFALKDKQDSRLGCWTLEKVVQAINFPFNDGLQVRVVGKFKLSKDSRIYLEVSAIQLTGQGELLRNLKLLEQKLAQEGLFDPARKRPIAKVPQKILLVASPHSAAVTDFVKVLASRRTGVEIFLLPIKTQGLGAEAVILEQLAKVNDLCEQLAIDTVVITRGGGSQDDLFVFNSEAVVRAIYGIAKPTIVAIGHERDTTLSELVADLRCATPSQAAEKVSLSNSEISWQAKSSLELIYRLNQQKVQQYYKYTWLVSATISQLVRAKVQTFKLVCQRTNQLASSLLNAVKRQVETSFYASQRSLSLRLQQIRGQAQQANQVIHSQVTSLLAAYRARLELLITKIELANPKTILAQGYALVWQNQVVQERVSAIDKHLPITIEMQDGSISARIWPQ